MARSKKNEPELPLYPYQLRWFEDDSRFKIACKARQIGFSFAATFRVVHRRRRIPGLTIWLSASERQAVEAMEYVRQHLRALGLLARFQDSFIEGTLVRQQQVRLPNGSRIVALPANPDTVRGFAGDIVLDEFAFHRDDEAIWRAAFATATRGYQIEIISTPNGARGKFYQLARAAGLVDWDGGRLPSSEQRATEEPMPEARRSMHGIFSPHCVSLAFARAEGFVVDVESLRAAISDEDAWQQEYCCRFLTEAAHFLPPEMVVAAEHPAATTTLSWRASSTQPSAVSRADPVAGATGLNGEERARNASQFNPAAPAAGLRPCYLGVDIGRRRDLTVLWLLEVENPDAPADARRYITRAVETLERRPFAEQRRVIDALLALRCEQDEYRNSKLETRGRETSFAFRVSSF
ncbi:MAG: terminase large subunit domain-containing protein, partial [Candidatus Acidiferrales bacterium]